MRPLVHYVTGKEPLIIRMQPRLTKSTNTKVFEYFNETQEGGATIKGKYGLIGTLSRKLADGQRCALMAGSVREAMAIDRAMKAEGYRVRKLDGTATPKKILKAFAQNPDNFLRQHDSQLVILTRVGETGLDIQQHFDAVFVLPSQGQSWKQIWQHMSRVRGLLYGDCNELHIALPDVIFKKIEDCDPEKQLDEIKQRNRYYLNLIAEYARETQPKVLEELQKRLNAHEDRLKLISRYRAEHTAHTLFRNTYLQEKFEALGWKSQIISTSATDQTIWKERLDARKRGAQKTEAHAIARAKNHLDEYSEAYTAKLEDPEEQGFLLGVARRKLTLARNFPASPLADAEWILEFVIDNPELLTQDRLIGCLIALAFAHESGLDVVKELRRKLSSEVLELGKTFGLLAMLNRLQKAESLAIFDMALKIAGDPVLLAAAAKTLQPYCKHDEAIKQSAAYIRKHREAFEVFSSRFLKSPMDWGEGDDVSLINKVLDKVLGCTITWQRHRSSNGICRVYELVLDDASRRRKAEQLQKRKRYQDKPLEEIVWMLTSKQVKQQENTRSAAQGWMQLIKAACDNEALEVEWQKQTAEWAFEGDPQNPERSIIKLLDLVDRSVESEPEPTLERGDAWLDPLKGLEKMQKLIPDTPAGDLIEDDYELSGEALWRVDGPQVAFWGNVERYWPKF